MCTVCLWLTNRQRSRKMVQNLASEVNIDDLPTYMCTRIALGIETPKEFVFGLTLYHTILTSACVYVCVCVCVCVKLEMYTIS